MIGSDPSAPGWRGSHHPTPAAPVVEALRDLARSLQGIDWYLCGGQAAVVHGRTVPADEVEVRVACTTGGAMDLVHTLERGGLQPRIPDIEDFISRGRRRPWARCSLPLRHAATGIAVDVVLSASPGRGGPAQDSAARLEKLFFDHAEPTDLGGVVVKVISPAHLVVTKVLVGEPEDVEDAAAVLRAAGGRGGLGGAAAGGSAGSRGIAAQVRDTLGLYAGLVDVDALLDTFAEVLARARPSSPGGRSSRKR